MARPPLTVDERTEALRLIGAAREVADDALTYILRALDHFGVAERVYARRHRIKTEDDVEDKVRRKRREPHKATYSWDEITDIVGLRFITLYRDDIAPVTDSIFSALLGTKTVSQSPFLRKELAEFRFYMANASPENDPLAIRLKEIAARHHRRGDKWKYKKPEIGERYSSVHFVTRVDDGGLKVPIEIQVRSVFEDAWGEIDHALLYEPRRMGVPMDSTFRQIERQSNALKKMMDSAADFADAIRSLRAPEPPPAYPMRPTLDDGKYVEQICRAISVPPLIRKKLMALVRRKEDLDSAFSRNEPGVLRSDYVRLGDDFADLLTTEIEISGFLDGADSGSEPRELVYLVRMEEAVSRLLSFDEQQVPVAIDRLRAVIDEFPDHPVAWYRLGEAYARRMDFQGWSSGAEDPSASGRKAYARAAAELERLSGKSERQRLFSASHAQEIYIRNNLSRVHAFLIWRAAHVRLAGRDADRPTHAAAREALDLTYSDLEEVLEPKARQRLLNSVAYFAAETIELARRFDVPEELPCTYEELHAHLDELESGAPTEGPEAMRVWDSIGYARVMLDGGDSARRAATKVLGAHKKAIARPPVSVSPYIREQEAVAVERALQILGIGDE